MYVHVHTQHHVIKIEATKPCGVALEGHGFFICEAISLVLKCTYFTFKKNLIVIGTNPKPIKIDRDDKVSPEDCQLLLKEYIPSHVLGKRIMAKLFLK